ncbi:MAG: ATP-binding protein [Acidimicrobiia bacterium]
MREAVLDYPASPSRTPGVPGIAQGLTPLSKASPDWQDLLVEPTSRNELVDRLSLWRRSEPRLIAGVAGGIADRVGVPAVYVRAAFVTLTTIWGIGVLLYLLIWWLTLDHQADPSPGELETGQRVGLGTSFVAGLWLLAGAGFVPDAFATFVIAAIAFGVAAVLDRSESGGIARLIMPGETQGVSVFRMVAGVTLLLIGLGLFFGANRVTSSLGSTFIAIALTAIGLMVAFGPWFVRMRDDLGKERLARARQEERAEMAAHLHDSVLQTLALIQRTENPRRMSSLARTQERELRTWLFGKAPLEGGELLSTALAAAAARIEDERAAAIDLVTVGDARLDSRGSALVAASTEAMVNAVTHAGADRVSVYLEVGEGRAEVWITDQGKGFDRSSVPADRRGLVESIERRIGRQGGTAEISSRPGEGTEVHLVLPGIELVAK